ncbi:MAG: hypothetical protein ACO388_10785, partial [Saprospiraceae bacterium]
MSKIKLTFKHIFSLIVVFFGSFLNAQEDADTSDPKASGNKEEAAKEAQRLSTGAIAAAVAAA